MQVKKFEAPTIQEALENVKRELGPEAIILQTKKNKRGFGLMSKSSVEVTAAVSERSLQKKQIVETRLPDPGKSAVKQMNAQKQADFFDQYADKHLQKAKATQDRVEVGQKKITATRYIDIEDDHESTPSPRFQSSYPTRPAPGLGNQPQLQPPAQARVQAPIQNQNGQTHFQPQAQPQMQPQAPLPQAAPHPLEEEVRHLRKMLEEMNQNSKASPDPNHQVTLGSLKPPSLDSPIFQDAFEQLVINGVDRRFALNLIKKVGFELGAKLDRISPEQMMDLVAVEIMDSVEVLSPLLQVQNEKGKSENGPVSIALIGPTGVGKTTTMAKLASEALLKRGLKVGLINIDNYKLTAFDQLGTYSKILNVPFRSAASIQDLKAALMDFKHLDLVLVDTTGRSQRDPESLKEMQEILRSIPELSTYIVLSATTRDAELYDAASRFSVFRPQGMIISKLDEATVFGGIYNVSQKVKLPLLYFTTGQKIPEDIEEATKERVASLVLDL